MAPKNEWPPKVYGAPKSTIVEPQKISSQNVFDPKQLFTTIQIVIPYDFEHQEKSFPKMFDPQQLMTLRNEYPKNQCPQKLNDQINLLFPKDF